MWVHTLTKNGYWFVPLGGSKLTTRRTFGSRKSHAIQCNKPCRLDEMIQVFNSAFSGLVTRLCPPHIVVHGLVALDTVLRPLSVINATDVCQCVATPYQTEKRCCGILSIEIRRPNGFPANPVNNGADQRADAREMQGESLNLFCSINKRTV
jgi:hypothetical protein